MFLHCKKLNHLYPWMICTKFAWNWPNGSGEKDFKFLTMYIPYFVIIFPWKRVGPFIWTNLNSLHPRKLCVKVGWNWPHGSGEKHFWNFANVCSLLHCYKCISPWVGGALHLNKFEFLSTKDAYTKFGWNWHWFWRSRRKCEKFQRWRQQTTDKFWSEKLRWAKNIYTPSQKQSIYLYVK